MLVDEMVKELSIVVVLLTTPMSQTVMLPFPELLILVVVELFVLFETEVVVLVI